MSTEKNRPENKTRGSAETPGTYPLDSTRRHRIQCRYQGATEKLCLVPTLSR